MVRRASTRPAANDAAPAPTAGGELEPLPRGRSTVIARAALLLALCLLGSSVGATEPLPVEELVERYLDARGGAERWRALETMRIRGDYTSYRARSRFVWIRQRGDLYRIDFTMLSAPAIRARDARGTWGQNKWFLPEPQRISSGPYKEQFERESVFGPLLLDYADRGIRVRDAGRGELDGRATYRIEVILRGGARELWHLDASTFLELAIDSTTFDFGQDRDAKARRAAFGDFREVGGVVFPHSIDLEFGRRLESLRITQVELDVPLDVSLFSPPPVKPSS